MLKVIFSFIFLLSPSLAQNGQTRAASTLVNCGCQCSNYKVKDRYGELQGNCNSVDNTGAAWCYVEQGEFVKSQSTCQDLKRSQRFPTKFWSYEACSTPSIYSTQCQLFGGGYNEPCSGSGCGSVIKQQPSLADLLGGRLGTGGAPPS